MSEQSRAETLRKLSRLGEFLDEQGDELSTWEHQFIEDNKTRYEIYKDDLLLSPRQAETIEKLFSRYCRYCRD